MDRSVESFSLWEVPTIIIELFPSDWPIFSLTQTIKITPRVTNQLFALKFRNHVALYKIGFLLSHIRIAEWSSPYFSKLLKFEKITLKNPTD